MDYYGISPSSDFFAHYGVKGMRWGVRKAIESGNNERLEKHYKKANKKLQSLKDKADVIGNLSNRKNGPALLGASLIPIAGGIGIPIVAKSTNHKMGVDDHFISGFNALAGAGMAGLGAHDLITGSIRSKAKGHDKAVKRVNDWQKEMKKTFQGTKYAKKEDDRPEYNDTYTLYEHGILGKDQKGRDIPYRAPTVSVKGSSLVRDNNDKAKRIFKKRLTDPPVTQHLSPNDKVLLAVHAPSGRVYSANLTDSLLKVKKKKR